VGFVVGANVGFGVGAVVGSAVVGSKVGPAVAVVGRLVGERVGRRVGEHVGESVGSSVGAWDIRPWRKRIRMTLRVILNDLFNADLIFMLYFPFKRRSGIDDELKKILSNVDGCE